MSFSTERWKRAVFNVPCPKCGRQAGLILSKDDLEDALKFGKLYAYDVACAHSWMVKLTAEMKDEALRLLSTEFSA
jgi:hypothetical protein